MRQQFIAMSAVCAAVLGRRLAAAAAILWRHPPNGGGVRTQGEHVMEATALFESTMDWLRERYGRYTFFAQRDIVWTVQKRIQATIEEAQPPYRVFNNHTISKGVLADLVILRGDSVEVAAKFKYEPSHSRSTKRGGDIWPSKLSPSVVFWTGEGSVAKDVQRIREYVEQGKAKAAYSVFIDEGGEFRHRTPHPGSEWRDWGGDVSVLWSSTPAT